MKRKEKKALCVIYDGVNNSVFEHQVLNSFITYAKKHKMTSKELLSFEPFPFKKQMQKNVLFFSFWRLPFVGIFSLAPQIIYLFCVFLEKKYVLVRARGVCAGFIAMQAAHWSSLFIKTPKIQIQLRGIASEEYRYLHENCLWWQKPIRYFCTQQLAFLEKNIWQKAAQHAVEIEVVSPALANYFTEKYGSSFYLIAKDDMYVPLSLSERTAWRARIRGKLSISPKKKVWVYAGSWKKWQGIEYAISYVLRQKAEGVDGIFLVLTQESEKAVLLLEKFFDFNEFRVLPLKPDEVIFYLASADEGLLFRPPHLLNWVSRPTKFLEYKAAGLKVIHNNTVAWCSEKEQGSCFIP